MMHSTLHTNTPRSARRTLAVLAAATLGLIPMAGSAEAHGTVIDPQTRNYGCLQRWGSGQPDEAEDPMCYRVYQENPNAITAWKAVYANNTGDDYQQAIPDGRICSAGGQGETDYSALDHPGPWRTTTLGSHFSVNVYDEARHGADWLQIYVSKQGYDPTGQPLRWADLELVATSGSYPGGSSPNYVTNAAVSGRSGHHVVLTVWKASHMDQKYFLCSDVNFS